MPGISAVPDDVNARYFHVVVAGPEVFSCNHTFFLVAGSGMLDAHLFSLECFLVDVCQLTSLFIEMASLVRGYFRLLQKGFWAFLKLRCYEQNDLRSV